MVVPEKKKPKKKQRPSSAEQRHEKPDVPQKKRPSSARSSRDQPRLLFDHNREAGIERQVSSHTQGKKTESSGLAWEIDLSDLGSKKKRRPASGI